VNSTVRGMLGLALTYTLHILPRQLYFVVLVVVPLATFDQARYAIGTGWAVVLSVLAAIFVALPAVGVSIEVQEARNNEDRLRDEADSLAAYIQIMEMGQARVDDN
jgi:hypothetical protein